MKIISKLRNKITAIMLLGLSSISNVFASTAGAGSDNSIIATLKVLQDFFTGALPTTIGMVAIAIGGVFIAVTGDIQGGGKKVAVIALGIGIALTAVNIFSWLGMKSAII
ncbi:MAG: hypothetical protein O2809_08530 [Proteobacteria bacterium]|nr:hypothetical protein [Pseudomonadota bacterium]